MRSIILAAYVPEGSSDHTPGFQFMNNTNATASVLSAADRAGRGAFVSHSFKNSLWSFS